MLPPPTLTAAAPTPSLQQAGVVRGVPSGGYAQPAQPEDGYCPSYGRLGSIIPRPTQARNQDGATQTTKAPLDSPRLVGRLAPRAPRASANPAAHRLGPCTAASRLGSLGPPRRTRQRPAWVSGGGRALARRTVGTRDCRRLPAALRVPLPAALRVGPLIHPHPSCAPTRSNPHSRHKQQERSTCCCPHQPRPAVRPAGPRW